MIGLSANQMSFLKINFSFLLQWIQVNYLLSINILMFMIYGVSGKK